MPTGSAEARQAFEISSAGAYVEVMRKAHVLVDPEERARVMRERLLDHHQIETIELLQQLRRREVVRCRLEVVSFPRDARDQTDWLRSATERVTLRRR